MEDVDVSHAPLITVSPPARAVHHICTDVNRVAEPATTCVTAITPSSTPATSDEGRAIRTASVYRADPNIVVAVLVVPDFRGQISEDLLRQIHDKRE